MFCGECGAKNQKGDAFCKECGAKLESGENTTTVVNNQPRKSVSKSTKIVIIVVVALIAVLGILFAVFSNLTNPKNVAKDYIQAVVDQDANKLYNYLELEGDSTYVSKEVFKSIIKENQTDSKVSNYKITGVEYSDGKLKATVKFKYTLEGSSSEKEDEVILIKQKGKKFLFFDDWKISDSIETSVVKDYKVKVTKGSELTFGGIKVTNKYLDKTDSTSKYDVYVLPQVFAYKTVVKAVLPSGLEIEQEVTPSSYYSSYTVSFDEDSLTDSARDKIITIAKTSLNTVYTSAIEKKAFADIKSNFEHNKIDLTALEKNYNDLVNSLSTSTNTLTSFSIDDMSIYDLELNNDGYLEVELKVNYDYEVKYKSYNDEEKTNSDSDYDYMTVILTFDNGSYYLVGLDNLETYFSRY